MRRTRSRTRLIADTNCLSEEITKQFLQLGSDYHVMLPDFVWMEVYKSNSIDGLRQSFQILKEFPKQVFHLKGTRAVVSTDPRPPAFGDRIIWPGATQEFERTLELIEKTPAVLLEHSRSFRRHHSAAMEHFEKMIAISAEFPEMFAGIESGLNHSEIKNIRRDEPYSMETIHRLMNITEILAEGARKSKLFSAPKVTRNSYFDDFTTRISLSFGLAFIKWVRMGSPVQQKPERLRNDFVDRIIATYATYFNGVLTKDKGLENTHLELRIVLEKLGARVPSQFL